MMKNTLPFSLRWVVALQSEAAPIIKEYNLKLIHHINIFKVYRNEHGTHWLIISGVGQVNAASASIFLYCCSKASHASFWFNVGVAQYSAGTVGNFFLVDKIVDQGTGQMHFPRPAFSKKIKKCELLTLDKQKIMHGLKELVDMEAYSFFDLVQRFSLKEMIAVLKVVSNYPNNYLNKTSNKRIEELIQDKMQVIKALASEAVELSIDELKKLQLPDSFKDIFYKIHFSKTQKIIFEKLARDWQTAFPKRDLLGEIVGLSVASQINLKMKSDLDTFKFDWTKG